MKINRTMNLVLPVESKSGVIYVHAMPIRRECFERYFEVIGKTFTQIYTKFSVVGGPRVAALTLKKVSQQDGTWDGLDGVENGLMNEIRRLTNVVSPGPNGWETIGYEEAVKTGLLDQDDIDEVENALVFFTVASTMHLKRDREAIVDGFTSVWGGQISSLNCTEFANSLPTSIQPVPSGATVTTSSVPY